MSELLYLFLGAAFVALICFTTAAIQHPHPSARVCAVASLPATCGDAR